MDTVIAVAQLATAIGEPGASRMAAAAAVADAAANGVFVAVADRCRRERGVDWPGGSVIVSPNGRPRAGPGLAGRPAVLTAACALHQARNKSLGGAADRFADRRPRLYARVLDEPA